MKTKTYFYAPLFGAMVALALTACSDDLDNGKNSNRPQGNGIVFGANANYAGDGIETRTEYGDVSDDGSSQEILWVSTDRVEIYSPESPNQQQVEYSITEPNAQDRGSAYLASYNGQNGLQWNTTEEYQNFYAVYPSPNSIANTAVKERVSYSNGILTGYVPINQQHTWTRENGVLTAKPNMDHMYMVAMNENFPVPLDGTDGGVGLNFMPLVTTLEITIQGPTEQPLASLNVETNGVPAVGNFTCDLINGSRDQYGVPECELQSQGVTNDYATVELYYEENGERQPLRLQSGESVTFNVFLLPTHDLTNVSIRIAGYNSASRTLQLTDNGTPITLHPHQKTRITVAAPQIGRETNEWISGINDNVYVSQLSIPGTANSFSYEYGQGASSNYQTQVADITTQWNAGIRCFELVGSEPANGDNLDSAPLLCNRTELGITFGQAVDEIWNLVQGSGEFAMIIPSYDSDTGHPEDGNGVLAYANALNQFYDTHTQYEYITYGRNVTVGEARGKLMFVARITSEEDAGRSFMSNFPTPHQGVFIDQWGSLRDNWRRRGYTLSDGTRVNNWATSTNDRNSMEYYMYNDDNTPTDLPTRVPANVEFTRNTSREDGSTGTAYVQDWQRVVQSDYNANFGSDWSWSGRISRDVFWQESLQEKKDDIWTTFMLSIDDNRGQQGSTFYINSLDGYFVDSNIKLSCTPYVASGSYGDAELTKGGTAGNIQSYATTINSWFYNEILGYGENNIYGAMNVVILDRVYASQDMTDPGSRLPSVIINNNYKFPLATAGGSTAQTDADASYTNGGAAWE